MKSLSSNADKAISRPNVAPILLVEISFFTPQDLTIYLCSRPFDTRNTFDGNVYDPLIMSFGDIDLGGIDPVKWRTDAGELNLEIANGVPIGGKPSLSKLLKDYDWSFSIVKIKLIFENATTAGDEVDLFLGHIETPELITESIVDLRISDIALGLRDRWPMRLVNLTDFSGADPDDKGEMICQVFGEAKRVKARAIAAGGKTTIAEDMTDSSPGNSGTLEITDGSAFPTGAFTLQVDAEQISIASRSGNVLTLASSGARGYGGTTATAHDKGADCAEVQTHYYYMAADHAVKSIDAVYVDGVRQEITNGSDSDCRVYYGDADDDLSDYEGKAIIDFQALPKVVKQVNLDTSVDTGSHNHTTTSKTTTYRYGTGHSTSGAWTSPASAYDNNEATYAYEASLTNSDYINITFDETDLGTVEYRRVTFRYSYEQLGSVTAEVRIGTSSYETFPYTAASGAGPVPQTISKIWYGDSWDLDVRFKGSGGTGAPEFYLYEVVVEVSYTPTIASSAATGVDVDLTGNSSADTVIGHEVTADIQGMFDRSDGFFTGTPNGIIKRPPHLFAKMLMHVSNGKQGLWGYWPCHEGTGTVLHDESGREQNTTTAAGTPEWSTGNSGLSCAKVVGSAEYFMVGNFNAPTQYITCAAWVKTDQAGLERFFEFGAGLEGGWNLACTTTTVRFYIWDDAPTPHGINSTQNIAGAWHHLAATYDGKNIRLYLDGVLLGADDTLNGQALKDADILYLGGYSQAVTTEFEEMRIYDRALSAYEILELYNNPRGANQQYIDIDEGMLHYWPFDENTGTTATDGKGSTDLTLTGTSGTPTWVNDATRGICLDFDDSDNQTAISSGIVARECNPTTAISVSAWFKVDDLAAIHDVVDRTNGFALKVQTDGSLEFYIHAGATWDNVATATGTISTGVWYHAIGTYDGTTIRLIVDNGTPVSTAHSVGGDITVGSGYISIGSALDVLFYFDGRIDDVFIFDYVLSSAETTALYDGSFEVASYTETGVKCAENGFELNVAIDKKPFTNDLLNDLARQCRSMQFFEADKHKLIYAADSPTTDKYLDGNRIDLDSISISTTLRAEIKNDWIANYDRHWSETGNEALRAEVVATAMASIAKYGKISFSEIFDNIAGSTHAQAVLNWLRDLLDEPQTLIELTGDPSFSDIERGDIVQLNVDYGVILHWPLFEGTGTTIEDNSGQGVTCTFNDGPTWAKYPHGNALKFDEVDDYIEVDTAYSDLFDFTSEDFSLAFWICPTALSASDLRVISKGISSTSGWEILYDANEKLRFRTWEPSSVDTYSAAMTVNEWVHMAVVRTGASVKWFRNGAYDNTVNGSHGDPVSNSGKLYIGTYQNGLGSYLFPGKLADIRIYNRALLENEIQLIASGKSAGGYLVDATFGMVRQSDQFRVIGKRYLSGFQQSIELVEA